MFSCPALGSRFLFVNSAGDPRPLGVRWSLRARAEGFSIGPLNGDFLRRANITLDPVPENSSRLSPLPACRLRTPAWNVAVLGVTGRTLSDACGDRPTDLEAGLCIVDASWLPLDIEEALECV